MIKKCFKCGGKGYIFDHMLGIFTLGMGYLAQTSKDSCYQDECNACAGSGLICETDRKENEDVRSR